MKRADGTAIRIAAGPASGAGAWRAARAAVLVLSVAALPACSPRPSVVVAGKNFTEQDVLAEIVAQQIERRTDLKVVRRLHLGGTFVAHQALAAGQVDVYVEYTGTALVAILQRAAVRDPDSALALVRAAYRDRFAAEWLAPLGFENTFAMIVRGSEARRLGVSTLSAAAARAPRWRAGFGYEFIERQDGWPGLARAYGLVLAGPPRVMDLGLTYRAVADSQVDLIAGNSTDGQIAALGLVVLADDRRYFPPYQAVPVARTDVLRRHPAVRGALEELGGTVTDSVMRRLNYLVDVEHREPAAVARAFLEGLRPRE